MFPDRTLQEAATAMVAAAERGRPVVTVLRKLCPYVYRQIAQDGNYRGMLQVWGRSVNVDENVGQTIVHPAILQAVGELAGIPMRGRFVHAGLQHTYGYLFSLIDTPYGAKRDRWVSTALERGFGFDLSLLGERPKEGTLLANLTWFLGHLVYRGQSRTLRRLNQNAGAVAPALRAYDYLRLPMSRIEERVMLAGKNRREVLMVTDLVAFPHPPADSGAESTLLIYSVRNGVQSPLKLITAFSVRPEMVKAIQDEASLKGSTMVRLRYNAYVSGLFGRTVVGQRHFVGPPG